MHQSGRVKNLFSLPIGFIEYASIVVVCLPGGLKNKGGKLIDLGTQKRILIIRENRKKYIIKIIIRLLPLRKLNKMIN